MQGRRFLRRLHALVSRLRKTRVIFPGHVTGIRKQAFFALADSMSSRRARELWADLVEAMLAGLPAVCLDHYGAREVLRPDCGVLVPRQQLREGIARLLLDPVLRARMGRGAREYAATLRFSDAAAALAGIIC